MQIFNKKYALSGSLTLFLCLIFTSLLALVLVTIESARTSSMKARLEGISHMGMESALGHFSIPLFEDYGLFAVGSTDTNFTLLLENYIQPNLSLSDGIYTSSYQLFHVNSYQLQKKHLYHFTDQDGRLFTNQILSYMKYDSITLATDFLFQADSINVFSKECADLSSIDGEDNETVNTSIDLSEFSGDASDESDLSEDEAIETKASLLECAKDFLTSASLTLYINDNAHISSKTISTAILPSTTCNFRNNSSLSVSECILFLVYLTEKFHTYTTSEHANNISLCYQLEYLLNGGDADDDNLLHSILAIQSMRTGLNLAYLYSDQNKRREARTLATAAVGLIEIPFIVDFTQFAILSAWATGEAVSDVRGLLTGNKIPLFKSKSTWNLSLSNLSSAFHSSASKNEENGLSYDQYLMLLLYQNFSNKTIYRTMDLIQLDLRQSNHEFRMSHCITGLNYEFTYQFNPLFHFKKNIFTHTFIQSYGY